MGIEYTTFGRYATFNWFIAKICGHVVAPGKLNGNHRSRVSKEEESTMIAAAIALVLAGQFGGSALDNALVDGDKVHLFLPPVVISEGALHGYQWSDDGRYLLTVTETARVSPTEVRKYFQTGAQAAPESTITLDVFNSSTGIVKTLWRADNKSAVTSNVFFFNNSDVALAQIHFQGETLLLRVTTGTSKVEVIETFEGQPTRAPSIIPDPLGKYIASQTFEPPTIRFIGQKGNIRRRVPLEVPNYGMFTKQGVFAISRTRDTYTAIDPDNGDSRIESGVPDYYFLEEPAASFTIGASNLPIPGRAKPVPIVMASANGKSIGVGFDALRRAASDSGVLYSTGAVNLVRPVIQISKSAFDEIVAKEERAEIMAKLSQIGKALMMFSGDNDGMFPTQEQLDNQGIDGYLGDPSLLRGFVYHSRTTMGESPARTEAGFMPCPGGKAVLYQDGHVVFVPDR